MMSLSSSQAGIVGARRKKLNQTQFSSYRNTKVEWNRPKTFSIESIPRSYASFIARSIYKYNKNNNTFTFLGAQKAQSLKREWVNQLVFTGSDPAQLDGTYVRSSSDHKIFLKSGNQGTFPRILREGPDWVFYEGIDNPIFQMSTRFDSITYLLGCDGCTVSIPSVTLLEIDNTTLKNINNNRLYINANADIAGEQLVPDVNFNINTANVFDTKNLAHNQKVFIDVRWTGLKDGKTISDLPTITMNDRKGIIYRIGVLIKDNTIDSMIYHNDLATDSDLIRQLNFKRNFIDLGI